MLTVDFDRLGLRPGDRVIDMGCGAGRHAFEMYRRGNVLLTMSNRAVSGTGQIKDALPPDEGFTIASPDPTSSALLIALDVTNPAAAKTVGTFEFYFPNILRGVQGSRISAFVDYGYVYARPGEFEFNQFRITTGLALQWQSPVGPISSEYRPTWLA